MSLTKKFVPKTKKTENPQHIIIVKISFLLNLKNSKLIKARNEKIYISIFWLISRLSKHNIPKIRIANRIFIERPSLYSTNIKDEKTSAVPRSFWSIIKRHGTKTIRYESIRVVCFWLLTCCILKNFAKANPVVNFANSDGWIFKPPIWNHDVAPFVTPPIIRTEIKLKIIRAYRIYESE